MGNDEFFQFLEIIFHILMQNAADERKARTKIWRQYSAYRVKALNNSEPERCFVAGINLFTLGDFENAIIALKDAVGYLGKRKSIYINDRGWSTDEFERTFLRYCEYLVLAYLTPLRQDPSKWKTKIEQKDIHDLIELLNKSKDGKKRRQLLAAAYEAAAWRVWVDTGLTKATRINKTLDHFSCAKGYYEDIALRLPRGFLELQEILEKSGALG